MRTWDGFAIHHSLTKDSGTLSWGAIRKFHTETQGWKDIGYHFGMEFVNSQKEILVGRPLNTTGSHAKGWNNKYIGVCMVGNFDNVAPSDTMLKHLNKYLLVPITLQLGMHLVNPTKPFEEYIRPHREVASWKSCPGTKFPMARLQQIYASSMKRHKL